MNLIVLTKIIYILLCAQEGLAQCLKTSQNPTEYTALMKYYNPTPTSVYYLFSCLKHTSLKLSILSSETMIFLLHIQDAWI